MSCWVARESGKCKDVQGKNIRISHVDVLALQGSAACQEAPVICWFAKHTHTHYDA